MEDKTITTNMSIKTRYTVEYTMKEDTTLHVSRFDDRPSAIKEVVQLQRSHYDDVQVYEETVEEVKTVTRIKIK